VGIGVLDHRAKIPETVAYWASRGGIGQVVEDGLVVLVDEHGDAVDRREELAEAADDVCGVAAGDIECLLLAAQQRQDPPIELGAALSHPAAEA